MVVFTGNTPGEVGGTVATIQMCLLFFPGTCHHTGKNNLGQKIVNEEAIKIPPNVSKNQRQSKIFFPIPGKDDIQRT